ncbi:hypothetical protein VB638_16960 [Dolichospermum sp. UHCC 0684]|uniref:hypothetical protein n=1 Tax=Nostocales TaxID=1161 RepID=UPI00029B5A1A|nr:MULTISPECIES: hypothetical protein [Nostocales]AFW95448.1 hypothetical protein ANA_C12739 [Anabaena sp. 90]MEA5531236.1 hypothetical protein [Dolichospermum sp. UHCC 0684]MTJ35202.1 hypothetical protein [Dolichospermum sp. UHCC 0260]
MKRYIPFFFIAFILFITVGDKVLPGALGKSSTQTRIALNNFAIDLFPNIKRTKTPNTRTEKAVEDLEQKR